MIIVELSGGLGNQMFQYALYLQLKKQGKKVKLNTNFFCEKNEERPLQLGLFEGVSEEEISRDIKKSNLITLIIDRVKSKVIKIEVYNDKIDYYQDNIFKLKNVLLSGYWQNIRYFESIKEEVKRIYKFKDSVIDSSNRQLGELLKRENSVSIHIRRGDYVERQNVGIYGQICTEKYYRNAIDRLLDKLDELLDIKLYFFSDDLEWIKDNLDNLIPQRAADISYEIVDLNKEGLSYQDMYLMSQCRHHIIANSTFSWWGAYLGDNADKIVIAPERWFQNHDTVDIICDDWIKVSGQ